MSNDRIRTTISVPSEIYDVFKSMADASGTSVSRCMGDWLRDTSDGAQLIAQKMQEARRSPLVAMQQFESVLASINSPGQIDDEKLRRQLAGEALARGRRPPQSPSSNTGVLVPNKHTAGVPSRKKQ